MKSLIVSAGNPIAFFVLLFGQVPGTINKLGGNMFQISFLGVLVLIVFGCLYLGVCAIFRKVIRGQCGILEYFGQVSATLFPFSVVGLILPVLLLGGMEGNVFGFFIALPAAVFTLIWILASLFAICKR